MAAATLQLYLESIRRELEQQDPNVLGVVVALAAVLLTFVFFILLRSRKSIRSAVLLADATKALSRKLVPSRYSHYSDLGKGNSYFSYHGVSNRNEECVQGPAVVLYDLPGHESLRLQYLEKHKADARAIVFVVDSVLFQKEVKDVAEFLYTLFTDAVIVKNAPPLLIACNKQDVTMAKSAKLIQQQLEKELNTLRMIRSGAPKSLDGPSTGGALPLGKKGKEFDFSQAPMKVEFVECSAQGNKGDRGEADIGSLEAWLTKVA